MRRRASEVKTPSRWPGWLVPFLGFAAVLVALTASNFTGSEPSTAEEAARSAFSRWLEQHENAREIRIERFADNSQLIRLSPEIYESQRVFGLLAHFKTSAGISRVASASITVKPRDNEPNFAYIDEKTLHIADRKEP